MGHSFHVLEDGVGRVGYVESVSEAWVELLVALGRALSDPV